MGGKSKYSRYEYFDNIEESGKLVKKIFSDFLEIGKPLKKIEF
jgi:hypothetical protein